MTSLQVIESTAVPSPTRTDSPRRGEKERLFFGYPTSAPGVVPAPDNDDPYILSSYLYFLLANSL